MSDRIERCCVCDDATGRAGKGEDSIYFHDVDSEELGPLCERCSHDYTIEAINKSTADNATLRAALEPFVSDWNEMIEALPSVVDADTVGGISVEHFKQAALALGKEGSDDSN